MEQLINKRFGIREMTKAKENPELFRASLGFDFIFTQDPQGKLRCFCIEINGHDSGISGVQDIAADQVDKTHRIVAGVRAVQNPERGQKVGRIILQAHKEIDEGLPMSRPEELQYIKQRLTKELRNDPMFFHAHSNPEFIQDITVDKLLQEAYIPEAYRPRMWHKGDDQVSSTGFWVAKNRSSKQGIDVHVIKNEHFQTFLFKKGVDIKDYIVQEYIDSLGAQQMPESVGTRAASLRLLMDFQYFADDTIVPNFVSAYQRVSPFSKEQTKSEEGEPLTADDRLVVNLAQGALSVAASPEEIKLAREAAEKIIQNIAAGYREEIMPDVALAS